MLFMKYLSFIFVTLFFLYPYNTFCAVPPTTENSEMMCGPNCLWFAARSMGVTTSLKHLRYFAETDPCRGTSLKNMLKALGRIGLESILLKTDWEGLNKIGNPTILSLNKSSGGHYVFMSSINSKTISLIDPPEKKTWGKKEFMNKFNGYAIIVCKNIEEKQELEKQFNNTRNTMSSTKIKTLLAIIIIFAVIICVLVLLKKK